MYYIYAYIDPTTDLPFYIGKGKGNRKNHHLNEASSKKENKEKWEIICSLKSVGALPIIKILEDHIDSEALAWNREDYYILKWGLLNSTTIGDSLEEPVISDSNEIFQKFSKNNLISIKSIVLRTFCQVLEIVK